MGGSTSDALDVVDRVHDFWDAIKGFFPTSFRADVSPSVDVINDQTGVLLSGLGGGTPASVAGTSGTIYNAYATALLLRLDSATVIRGRKLRGHWFIGPVRAATDADGTPAAADRTAVVAATTHLGAGSTTSSHVIWSRPKPPLPAGEGDHGIVNSYSVAPYFAVLRSRRD